MTIFKNTHSPFIFIGLGLNETLANVCVTSLWCLCVHVYFPGLTEVPEGIPLDTKFLDLQNNRITELKEHDFKGLTNLYVRSNTFSYGCVFALHSVALEAAFAGV